MEILAAKVSDYGINPFVSGSATLSAEANFAQGEVKVIVNDNQVILRDEAGCMIILEVEAADDPQAYESGLVITVIKLD